MEKHHWTLLFDMAESETQTSIQNWNKTDENLTSLYFMHTLYYTSKSTYFK